MRFMRLSMSEQIMCDLFLMLTYVWCVEMRFMDVRCAQMRCIYVYRRGVRKLCLDQD